ncbi:MAG: hypothetical protein H7A23_09190 [Leptospiraceae bacterium]|nr:hypothetical protein [Leptospiraceae bacterium]MCP5494717.1 hypothetical protein [Leptospiraceae bacterium]
MNHTERDISKAVSTAVESKKPVSIMVNLLSSQGENLLNLVVKSMLKKINRSDIEDTCYAAAKGLVFLATKAIVKRALFKECELNMNNPTDYNIGMKRFAEYLSVESIAKFSNSFKKFNPLVKTIFYVTPEYFSVRVKNEFTLIPTEEVILKSKFQNATSLSELIKFFIESSDDSSAETAEKLKSKGEFIDEYKIDRYSLKYYSSEKNNETIIKIDIPLTDRFTLKKEAFQTEMEKLFLQYKAQLDEAIHTSIETIQQKTEFLYKDIKTEFINTKEDAELILGKIQDASIHLLEQQENILSDFGEKIVNDAQNRLIDIQLESEKVLDNIKNVGNDLLSKEKQKVEDFAKELDEKISRQSNKIIEKEKKKIEDFNKYLDERVSRQSKILLHQVQAHLDQLENANVDFIKISKQELAKSKEEYLTIKSDLDKDVNSAKKLKLELLQDIGEETKQLKESINSIDEKIQSLESGSVLKSTENSLQELQETFNRITSTIKTLKDEENNLSEYIKNTEMIKSINQTAGESLQYIDEQNQKIKNLQEDLEKTNNYCDIIQERSKELSDSVDVIKVLDSKFEEVRDLQKIIENMINEVYGMSKKIGQVTNTVSSQDKKAQGLKERIAEVVEQLEYLEVKEEEMQKTFTELDKQFSTLNLRSTDIKFIESKFEKIENLMSDLSLRHKQVVTMEKRLEEIRGGFKELINDVETKYEEMNNYVNLIEAPPNKNKKSRPRKTNNGINGNIGKGPKIGKRDKDGDLVKLKKAKVLSLYENYNWSPEVIAEKLNLEQSLVDTIINLSPKS